MHLPKALRSRILAHALAASPEECCGVLVGEPGYDGVRVLGVVAARNAAADRRRRFSIDVGELFAIHRAARGEGRQVVGYYHSHPGGEAEPSATDEAESFAGARHLIVGLGEGAPAMRCWCFRPTPREEVLRPC